jgi:hypothetical protein
METSLILMVDVININSALLHHNYTYFLFLFFAHHNQQVSVDVIKDNERHTILGVVMTNPDQCAIEDDKFLEGDDVISLHSDGHANVLGRRVSN